MCRSKGDDVEKMNVDEVKQVEEVEEEVVVVVLLE